MTDFKKRFKKAVKETIQRDGIDNLMEWLENETNFFTSPASTRYHGSYEGGLVEHSLNVFNQMLFELDTVVGKGWEDLYPMESVAIVALFHDLCKVGQYRETEKWRKDADGQWESYLAYEYDPEQLTMGHGAKSNFLLQRFIHLTTMEAQAIFWHMGAYDISPYANLNGCGAAFETNPLAFLIHRADMAATYVIENENFEYAQTETEPEVGHEESVEEKPKKTSRKKPAPKEEVVEEAKEEPKAGITRRRKSAPKEEEVEEQPKKSSKIRMPKKAEKSEEPEPEPEVEESDDNVVAPAGHVRNVYYFYSQVADVYYKKEENEPDDDSDILVDEEEYMDAMCPVLEEDFFYELEGKVYKLAKGERLPEEYDEETWEPITEAEYIKRTQKPKAVAKPTRKTPAPSRRPRP
jgi:hypothetical protein|nr:MAG TPA: Putative helicase [Caudoviricetes sp.]